MTLSSVFYMGLDPLMAVLRVNHHPVVPLRSPSVYQNRIKCYDKCKVSKNSYFCNYLNFSDFLQLPKQS